MQQAAASLSAAAAVASAIAMCLNYDLISAEFHAQFMLNYYCIWFGG